MTVKEAVLALIEACENQGCDKCPYTYEDSYSGPGMCALYLETIGTPTQWNPDSKSLGSFNEKDET